MTDEPLKHPLESGEYADHSNPACGPCLQSTCRPTLFSQDGGRTWFDVDIKVPWWKRIFGIRRHYVKFKGDAK